ncbi:MAG: hypothetical protein C0402_01945 [Thermodesulfovibrio sp.]|nr:hypothetical protein [Thermodesulfovibrio sp.]
MSDGRAEALKKSCNATEFNLIHMNADLRYVITGAMSVPSLSGPQGVADRNFFRPPALFSGCLFEVKCWKN